MVYSYNYNYLMEFMNSHRLAKKDLLEALGCKDYTSLNKWLEGKVPVHVTAMLRFCNYYNTPVTQFFVDEDGMPCGYEPMQPNKTAQLLPTDDYGIKEGVGRGIVETKIDERIITTHEQTIAVAEGLQRQAEQRTRRDAAMAEMAASKETMPVASNNSVNGNNDDAGMMQTILRMQLDHANELREVERTARESIDGIRERYDDERTHLLNIIEQQSREIARLTNTKEARAFGNIQGDNGFIGVAEGITPYSTSDTK